MLLDDRELILAFERKCGVGGGVIMLIYSKANFINLNVLSNLKETVLIESGDQKEAN